jgi:hypothetical protein
VNMRLPELWRVKEKRWSTNKINWVWIPPERPACHLSGREVTLLSPA